MDIGRFVSHAHPAVPEFKRFTLRILENRVMLKTKLGSTIRIGISLRPESLLQGANWAVCAVVRQ